MPSAEKVGLMLFLSCKQFCAEHMFELLKSTLTKHALQKTSHSTKQYRHTKKQQITEETIKVDTKYMKESAHKKASPH